MKACRSTSSHTDSSGAWERSGWEETTNAAGENLRRDTGLQPVRDAHRFQKDLASLLQEQPARAGGPCHGEAFALWRPSKMRQIRLHQFSSLVLVNAHGVFGHRHTGRISHFAVV